jgi:radical SAM superfamily enzyme YgiQ (UPF0313 family)
MVFGFLRLPTAFLPDEDGAEVHRRTRTPVLTYERQRPVQDFPVIAFSVAYELELAGMLEVLDLCGLPLLREERGDGHPLVVAGGPLTFSNPDPLEPFADVLVQGEAEELVHRLVDEVAGASSRAGALEALAAVPGFRVPALDRGPRFHVHRSDDARLPARSQIVTPNTELRSMFLIEPERGCSRGCHYCVMRRTTNGGMRTVPPGLVRSLIPDGARRVACATRSRQPSITSAAARMLTTVKKVPDNAISA